MGRISSVISGQEVYLNALHLIGRDPKVVNTPVNNPLCSRLQCLLRYQESGWLIVDKSKNGTFVNGERLPAGAMLLHRGDRISFSGNHREFWQVLDVSAPQPVLVCRTDNSIIELACVNILPHEDQPELMVYKQADKWILDRHSGVRELASGDSFFFGGHTWDFYPNDMLQETVTQALQPVAERSDIILKFFVSLHEENVQLCVNLSNEEVDMGYKSHHQILLSLARQRLIDRDRGVPYSDHGWIATDVLLEEMAIDKNNLNILIFRSRKAFAERFPGLTFIERRQGEVRLRNCALSLNKGDQQQSYR